MTVESPHHCWSLLTRSISGAFFFVCFSSFCFFLNDFSHFDGDNDNYLYLFFREIIYSVSSARLSQMTLFPPLNLLLVLTLTPTHLLLAL